MEVVRTCEARGDMTQGVAGRSAHGWLLTGFAWRKRGLDRASCRAGPGFCPPATLDGLPKVLKGARVPQPNEIEFSGERSESAATRG